ncbi:MAG: biotin/lipoyl-binding protein [Burkholderiales bacterium]|nr:biotin/lipoyl-binding protein [Burkholderiales bacterium]
MSFTLQAWLALWARYFKVFGAAWQYRHELAGPSRMQDEIAFLPAALSLQETPPHPAPRRAAWVLCALFTAAIAWSIVGEVDIVAVAPGRIIVSERSKIIQPLEAGTVKAIHVQDGSKVKAGQILIELDATQSAADVQRIQQDKQAAQIEQLRAEALLGALENHRPVSLANANGISRADAALAQQQLQSGGPTSRPSCRNSPPKRPGAWLKSTLSNNRSRSYAPPCPWRSSAKTITAR